MAPKDNLQEIQMLEQNLQSILYQKQLFQMELSETENTLEEIENSGDEVFKIVGQIMIKTEKSKMKKDLEEKKKLIQKRVDSMDAQEKIFSEKLEKLRDGMLKSEKKKK